MSELTYIAGFPVNWGHDQDYIDGWQTVVDDFNALTRSLITNAGGLVYNWPSGELGLGEGIEVGSERLQPFFRGGTENFTNKDGATLTAWTPQLRCSVHSVASLEKTRELNLNPPRPTVTNFRDAAIGLEMSLPRYSANFKAFQGPTPRKTISDGQQTAGRPPLAYHPDAEAAYHGCLYSEGYLIPQWDFGTSLYGVNAQTGERWERKGWNGYPETLTLWYPGMPAEDDPFSAFGENGVSHSQDYFAALGLVGEGQALVRVERHYRYPWMCSNFDRRYTTTIDYPPEGEFLYRNDFPHDEVQSFQVTGPFERRWRIGWPPTVWDFDPPEYSNAWESFGHGPLVSTLIPCGGLIGNPRRPWGFHQGRIPGPPHLHQYRSRAQAESLILTGLVSEFTNEVKDYPRFLGVPTTRVEAWWEIIDVKTGNMLHRIDGRDEFFETLERYTNGPTNLVTASGSLTGLGIYEIPDKEGYFKISPREIPGFAGGIESPFGNLARGYGRIAFLIGDYSIYDPPNERDQWEVRSLDAGVCAGQLDFEDIVMPNQIYIYWGGDGFEDFPNLGPRARAVNYILCDFYSPLNPSPNDRQTFQLPEKHADGTFACDGTLLVFPPRSGTYPALGFVEPLDKPISQKLAAWNDTVRDLHHFRFMSRSSESENFADTVMVNTFDLAGPIPGDNLPQGAYDPRSGDCVSNLILTRQYLYCVIYGGWGERLCKFASRDILVEGNDTPVYTQGQLVESYTVTSDPEQNIIRPWALKSRDNLVIKNRRLVLIVRDPADGDEKAIDFGVAA